MTLEEFDKLVDNQVILDRKLINILEKLDRNLIE